MKHKYPTNWWFEMIVNDMPYQVTIDMFDDQDEFDDNFNYCVEIFPQNQSKESFESAEFWGTYTSENGVHMTKYPSEWSDQDKKDMAKYVVEEVSAHVQDFCDNCDDDVTESATYETDDGRTLCEECYIQYLAKKKGLVVE